MPDWNGDEIRSEQLAPNGWEIVYEPKPKRRYLVNGRPVAASITEILKVLDKPALSWWGQCIGIAGLLQLREMGWDIDSVIRQRPAEMEHYEFAKLIASGVLHDHKLTTNDQRDKAGTRGKSVHDALQRYATELKFPDPQEYPPTEQGYVIALIAFLQDVPTLRPEAAELMVASEEYDFAGRYDLRASTKEPHRVVTKVYPSSPAKTTTVPPGRFLFDLKTAVDVFPEHALQLGGYEGASLESGYEPTDAQIVVQCGTDGRYQARRSRATFEDFLAIRDCWLAYNRVDEALKIPYR